MALTDELSNRVRGLRDQWLLFSHSARLARQLWRIERLVDTYDHTQRRKLAGALARELGQAAASPEPSLYQSTRRCGAGTWGDGTAIAWQRIVSDNAEVQIFGVARWLAVAYHELEPRADPSSQGMRRRIIRISRQMKEVLDAPTARRDDLSAAGRLTVGV